MRRPLATAAPPAPDGTFSLIEGTANPETFLVGAQPGRSPQASSASPVTLLLAHYDPAARAVRLAPVRLPRLTGKGLTSVAISPDGSRVAAAYQDISKGVRLRTSITVYPLPGGQSRTWSAPGSFKLSFQGHELLQPTNDIGALSWAADDRTLAFPLSAEHSGVYRLDTEDTRTASLLGASRLTVPLTGQRSSGGFACADDPRITASGADILCGGYTIPAGWLIEAKGYPRGPVTQGFAEFSVATGKLVSATAAPGVCPGRSASPSRTAPTPPAPPGDGCRRAVIGAGPGRPGPPRPGA